MEWSSEALDAVARVPFFVRKRVKKRIEEEASREGAKQVLIRHVEACKRRFLERQEEEVKGYAVETCFGAEGCPHGVVESRDLVSAIEALLAGKKLREILRERVQGPLKLHHEFRVSVSSCPNACSRPQIVDVGILGACVPRMAHPESCTLCGACGAACGEEAIAEKPGEDRVEIDSSRCLACGRCIRACPFGVLEEERSGYRVLLGGRLGRHPRLGREVSGLHTAGEVLELVERCVDHIIRHSKGGERFGILIDRIPMEDVTFIQE